MKIVAVMPIKLVNERCPGKNIRLLGGKPLLRYELDSLLQTGLCDEIYVYCSDDAVVNYLPDSVIYLKRPKELDSPTSNFSQIFESFMGVVNADIYVYAHATAPYIKTETIQQCIDMVRSGKYDSAFCAEKLQDYLWKNGEPINFDATCVPRTQDLEPIYKETSGVYVFKKYVFEKFHRRVGITPFIKEVTLKEAIDIDTQEDFRIAEMFVNKLV